MPGKNIKLLCGKPLIAHSIECALGAKRIDRVIVSTDDPEIADVARRFGAEVPFLRPDYLATDDAKAIDNYVYTVDRLSREWNKPIDDFAVLLPTAPLRTSADVDGAISLFYEKKADSVVSYTPEAHPVRWHKYLDENNAFIDIFDPTIDNRQALRTSYYPNGAIYVFRTEVIKSGKYYTDKSFAYVMPRSRSVDIDTIEDFEYANFLLQKTGFV